MQHVSVDTLIGEASHNKVIFDGGMIRTTLLGKYAMTISFFSPTFLHHLAHRREFNTL